MDKKELKNLFKERVQIGGVFAIQNTLKRKLYIDSAKDIAAAKIYYDFFNWQALQPNEAPTYRLPYFKCYRQALIQKNIARCISGDYCVFTKLPY